MSVIHVCSVSSGKDSDETLRQCLARVPRERVRAVICDTGNEHKLVWQHIAYLEQRFGIVVEVLRANFDDEIAAKRRFIALDVRRGRDKKGRRLRWSNKAKRRALAELRFERLQPRTYAFRPLVDWAAAQVFASLALHDVEVNGLYRQGMNRVGCMPCINCSKPELREIALRWPEHPERLSEWERRVGACSKRGYSTFFTGAHPAVDRRMIFADLNVWSRIEWSKTTRGGQQYDLLAVDEPAACASSYGLCE